MGQKNNWNWLLVAVGIGIFWSIFFNNSTIKRKAIPEEFTDSENQARKKFKQLKKELVTKEKLKKRLEHQNKRTYLWIRILIIKIWALVITLLIYFKLIQSLEDALNYSEAAILILLAFHFLIFGKLSNLNHFVELTRIRIQNLIYRRHANIEKDIVIIQEQLKEHKSFISTTNNN